MLEFFHNHQLNIMFALCGSCGICAVFVLFSHRMSWQKKRALFLLELCSMALLIFDRGAEMYNGDPSETGMLMVWISNFLLYFFSIAITFFYNLYLIAVISDAEGFLVVPFRLKVTSALAIIGEIMVIVSQFTGLYYTIDSTNTYQRAPGFIISYIIPVLIPILQLTFVLQTYKKIHKGLRVSLALFPAIPLLSSILQMMFYGVLLTDISLAVMSVLMYIFALRDVNATVDDAKKKEIAIMQHEKEEMSSLFKEMVSTFVSSVDEKDVNRRGHAVRVADYSRKLAETVGKSKEECEDAYFSALLHDVGKISLPDKIIKNSEKLTKDEQVIYEQHVIKGMEILAGVTGFPHMKEAAGYHHEWYDGTGYPGEYSGEEIPELARLVAVADGYDEMASIRDDREPLPQQVIREEIIKESGTHYDPAYVKAMIDLIDNDKNYQLREHHSDESDGLETELTCKAYRSKYTRGIPVTDEICRVSFSYKSTLDSEAGFSAPSIILFTSMDGRIHTTEQSIRINRYIEFGEAWFNGHHVCTGARNMKARREESKTREGRYLIEIVRVRDHTRINLLGGGYKCELTVALPDSSGDMFVSLTGENGYMTRISADLTGVYLKEGDITRIADEITYTDRMVGHVPNIQIDGFCSLATEGQRITDKMQIIFHTMTLPGANLVWHCPFLVFFKSDDHRMYGSNYEEIDVVRLDGESSSRGKKIRSITEARQGESFKNWDVWKEYNKRGYECKVMLRRYSNRIVMYTENGGISVKSTIQLEDRDEDVLVAITGDQCALTDIRFVV